MTLRASTLLPPETDLPVEAPRHWVERPWRFYVALTLILLLALGLRLITIRSRCFWTDECYSYWFTRLSWTDLWTKTPLYETHPPFYYSILKIWAGVFGSSELGLRSLSVLASVASVALVAVAPRILRMGPDAKTIGLLGALLRAINEASILYAEQARPYAIQSLVVGLMLLMSALLLQRLLADDRDTVGTRGIGKLWIAMGVLGGITLWLHNTSPVIILGNWSGLGLAILLFSRHRWRDLATITLALVVAILVWAPGIPILLQESRTVAFTWWATITPRMFYWPLTLVAGGNRYPWLVSTPLVLLALYRLFKADRAAFVYGVTALYLPMVALFTASYLFRPVYVPRLFEWMGLPTALLAAYGSLVLMRRSRRAGVLMLAALMAICLVNDGIYYRSQVDDIRGLVDYAQAHVQPDDLVVVYPNDLTITLFYYRAKLAQPFDLTGLPAEFPALNMKRPYLGSNKGVPDMIESDRQAIDRQLIGHPRIWFVSNSMYFGAHDGTALVFDELTRQRGKPVGSTAFRAFNLTEFH